MLFAVFDMSHGRKGKQMMKAQFWGAHQRFFRQVRARRSSLTVAMHCRCCCRCWHSAWVSFVFGVQVLAVHRCSVGSVCASAECLDVVRVR